MDNLNTAILLAMPLLLPPVDEQREIARECDEAARAERREVELLRRSQQLLLERKQALITAAVTGQFDVTTARSAA